MTKALAVYEKIYVVFFLTDTKGIYDTFYLGKDARNKLLKDLNEKRVVQVGQTLLASRLFEKSVPFEAVTVPDERVRYEFAHKIANLKKGGRGITPQLAHQIEMRLLVEKSLAFEIDGPPAPLREKYTKSVVKPAVIDDGDDCGKFFVIKNK